ncbi:MAG: hypothetical protein E7D19_24380 [Klebsiella grimontii]|nr:hypothetical protein [Klebsiella grimontii]
MDDKKPVLLTLHEALRLDLIEAYVAREITLAEVAESMELTRVSGFQKRPFGN